MHIFDIINQLNQGVDLISTLAEQVRTVALNVQAGQKAKAAFAYRQAAEYLEMWIECLPVNAWDTEHDLAFTLYKECVESQYLTGNFERSQALCEQALQHTASVLEEAQIYNLQVCQYSSQAKFWEAIETGLEGLNLLGVEMPDSTDRTAIKQAIEHELALYTSLRGQRAVAEFADLPAMTDPLIIKALEIGNDISDPAILSRPEVFSILAIKGVNLSLTHGNSPLSAAFYLFMGITLAADFRDYRNGYELAMFGLQMCEEIIPNPAVLSRALGYLSWNTNYWMNPIITNPPLGDRAHQVSLETSNILYAAYALVAHPVALLMAGRPLDEITDAVDRCIRYSNQNQQLFMISLAAPIRQLARCLQGHTNDPLSLNDETFDEASFLEQWQVIDSVPGHFYVRKLQLVLSRGLCEIFGLQPG